MILPRWEKLPEEMRLPEVRPYYEILRKKPVQLVCKRAFDLVFSALLLVVLTIPMAVIAAVIKADSPGSVFYRQERVTTFGKHFFIHKFRTMVTGADQLGTAVTVGGDARITRVGAKLRRYRLDELPQVLDVLCGRMSLVGTRPEAVRYAEAYKPEYVATLLLPAGITSEASIRFKDEAALLQGVEDIDGVYIRELLPQKMQWNLDGIRNFSLWGEAMTLVRTVLAVLGKEYR